MGKRLTPCSITSPLGKINLPSPITEERCRELTIRLKTGDKNVSEELILGHIRLGVYIAGLYTRFSPRRKKDLVSEAMLALVEWTGKAEKNLKNDDFTRYIAFKIHRACGNYIYNDRLITIPLSTRCLHKLKDLKIEPEQETGVNNNTLDFMVLDEAINNATRTKLEKAIIDLRKEEYTHQEIADILNVSRQWISVTLSLIEERFIKEENK